MNETRRDPPPDRLTPDIRLLRFEHRHEPMIPLRAFVMRMVHHGLVVMLIILVSLGLGVTGYHVFGRLHWLDALVNASMILAGMGPVDPIGNPEGKWFAAFYALYSGMVFLTSVGIFLAPLAHRLLHHFHLSEDGPSGE